LGNGGQSRTTIFSEGAKAEGWFLKETLIDGNKKPSPPPWNGLFPQGFLWAGTSLLIMLFEVVWVAALTHI